jgi:hypothetical protein
MGKIRVGNLELMFQRFILSLLLIGCQFIQAQNSLDILGLSSLQPANVAFSVRKLSSTYTGPLFRVLVGSTYYDVYPDASADKHLSMASKISTAVNYSDPIASPTSASLSSIILATTQAYVAIWYDQSGNANHLKNSNNSELPTIIYNGNIITEGPYNKPFLKWLGASNPNSKYLALTNFITNNGQVIIVNKFDQDGFLLGDNNIFLGGGGQGSYRWHSGPHLSPQRLFDENGWATLPIRNGAIYQNGIFRADNLSTTYNQTLGINSVAPTDSRWEYTYWDNIGEERPNSCDCHATRDDNSGYSELLSFPSSLSNIQRATVEVSQSDYFGIALYGRAISLTTPLVNPLASNCSVSSPSTPTTFGVTGTSLYATLTVSAPSGFEISENASSGFTSSISLIPDGSGTVSTTLYVRLAAGFFSISGNISASSPGTTTQHITINGNPAAVPVFSPSGPFLMCVDATYLVSLFTPNSFNGWSSSNSSVFSVTASGYITASQVGSATITYTDACGQSVSQTVVVQSSAPSIPLTDNSIAYKFNGSPQGPFSGGGTINYVGTDGFTYFGQTQPIAVGFYNANVQTGSQAGCPTRFYIFNCTTCNN